jgi:hypothetical protein
MSFNPRDSWASQSHAYFENVAFTRAPVGAKGAIWLGPMDVIHSIFFIIGLNIFIINTAFRIFAMFIGVTSRLGSQDLRSILPPSIPIDDSDERHNSDQDRIAEMISRSISFIGWMRDSL